MISMIPYIACLNILYESDFNAFLLLLFVYAASVTRRITGDKYFEIADYVLLFLNILYHTDLEFDYCSFYNKERYFLGLIFLSYFVKENVMKYQILFDEIFYFVFFNVFLDFLLF